MEHEQYRILSKDIAGYTGNAQTDKIKKELRYLFDPNNPEASKAVLVASYGVLRTRSSLETVVESDEEDGKMITELSSRFPTVFGHVIMDEGQAIKNPATKLSELVKGLKASFHWILTGTPFSNRVEDFVGIGNILFRETWYDGLSAWQRKQVDGKDFYPYNTDFDPDDPRMRFMLHPKCLQRLFKRNEADIAAGLDKVYNNMMVRRMAESKLPNGNTTIGMGISLPILQTKTIEVVSEPEQEAEIQLFQRHYAEEFLKNVRPGTKGKENDKSQPFFWPSKWYRRMCLLADGLILERLNRYFESRGFGTLSADAHEWRRQGIDYRYIVDATRIFADEVPNTKLEYLEHIAKNAVRLRPLCAIVEGTVISGGRKLLVFYDWAHLGLLIEKFFEALHIKVATIHAGMPEAERAKLASRFSDPEDKSIEMLVCSDRTSAFGLNLQGDCNQCVIAEAAVNINTEQQAMCRVYRVGQKAPSVLVTRLKIHGGFDEHREFRQGEKMYAEIASWSTGQIMQDQMTRLLVDAGIEVDEVDLIDPSQLRIAASKIVEQIQGRGQLREGATTPMPGKYSQLKRSASATSLLHAYWPPPFRFENISETVLSGRE